MYSHKPLYAQFLQSPVHCHPCTAQLWSQTCLCGHGTSTAMRICSECSFTFEYLYPPCNCSIWYGMITHCFTYSCVALLCTFTTHKCCFQVQMLFHFTKFHCRTKLLTQLFWNVMCVCTPVHIPKSDSNLPCAFKCIYSTSQISIFLAQKNICHDLWSDAHNLVHLMVIIIDSLTIL
jgi:hypothetical protein